MVSNPVTIITALKMVAEGSSMTLPGGSVAPRSLMAFAEVL